MVEAKIDAAIEAWKKLSKDHRSNGVVTDVAEVTSLNGTTPVRIDDIRDLKSSLAVTAGPRPVRDLSFYEDRVPKL